MAEETEYKHNHYVPKWYQKRFMKPDQEKYFCLDLKPETVISGGQRHKRRDLRRLGPPSCFGQNDLYTVEWGEWKNVDIEKFFFGKIDRAGQTAVKYFGNFEHPSADQNALQDLMTYMSVQKLRTPKGLGWVAQTLSLDHKNYDLIALQKIQNIFCAIWTECVWQIADATQSNTKFIISDHPVTVYNRACFPMSGHCKGFNDPDVRRVATHTYFPLSLEKVLILTNLAWVRNPYQSEAKLRPNPDFYRDSFFNYTAIQIFRNLTEEEVLQINYITKMRALRYIAGAEREWLYPEKFLKKTHWRNMGNGYLLMPEPRDINMGGEVIFGYAGGRSDSFSEYGHKPWQKGFKDDRRFEVESAALHRFQAAFARMQGPAWRGTSFEFHQHGPRVDSDEFHQHHLVYARRRREAEREKKRRR